MFIFLHFGNDCVVEGVEGARSVCVCVCGENMCNEMKSNCLHGVFFFSKQLVIGVELLLR